MAVIDETPVFSLTDKASFQALGEGAVILMIDTGQIYTCNETTEAFLKVIDGQRNLGSILDLLLAEFDADRETLANDFAELAQELQDEGIIEVR
jgi:Coenzyme PQQ synthesis protein D (PqqD)